MRWVLLLGSIGCAPLDNIDPDGDGYSASAGDCEPLDPDIYPGVGDCPAVDDGSCTPFPSSTLLSGPWDGHYAGAAVEIRATGVVDPELTLAHDGEPVPGTWVAPEDTSYRWVFEPSNPILPGTSYTWEIQASGRCETHAFTTSQAGLPVVDPAALIGRVFEVAVDQHPTTATSLLFFEPPFWIRIDDLDSGVATTSIAPVQPPGALRQNQYTCVSSTVVTGSWDGSRLTLAGDALSLPVGLLAWSPFHGAGVDVPQPIELLGWELQLVIHPDGMTSTLDHFDVTADTRSLGDFYVYGSGSIVGRDGTPTNFCTVANTIAGVVCEPCADSLETCLPLAMIGHETIGGLAPSTVVHVGEAMGENRLCEGSCDNEVDDDGDGAVDSEEPECAGTWP